jgi:GNAT superfamily N-acetyltransferase
VPEPLAIPESRHERVLIREATPADREAVLDLGERFITAPPYNALFPTFNREHAATFGFDLLLHWGVVIVAEQEGQIVGALLIEALPHVFTGTSEIAKEVVWFMAPEHRRGLAGVKMLRFAEEWCRQNGVKVLIMVAPAAHPDVGHFLRRTGYTDLETALMVHLA